MHGYKETGAAHELHNNFIIYCLTIAISCEYKPWLASGHVKQTYVSIFNS